MTTKTLRRGPTKNNTLPRKKGREKGPYPTKSDGWELPNKKTHGRWGKNNRNWKATTPRFTKATTSLEEAGTSASHSVEINGSHVKELEHSTENIKVDTGETEAS